MSKQVLDEQTKQAIDNYGKRIQTLKDFVTAVRKVPGMYITFLGDKGFLNMIREVFQNSIDQIKSAISPCDHIWIYYSEKTLQVTVEDNGLGLPFDDMVRILTSHHTSANYEKRKGEYSSGRHGSGLKVTNALSSRCAVESFHYSGVAKRLDTKEGYPVKDPYDIPNKEGRQGTRITFFPCVQVLGELNLSWVTVYEMVKSITSLTPIGSTVTFVAEDFNGVKHEEEIVNKDGIMTELFKKVKAPIVKPIRIVFDDGTMMLETAFCFDSGSDGITPDPNEYVVSFCNMTPTNDGGTHVDGTLDGIYKWFTLYMNNIFLNNSPITTKGNKKNKSKSIKVTTADIKMGLNVVVSAFHLEPTFGGQGKDTVTNGELDPFCKEVVMKGLDEWSKKNPQDLSKLCRYFREMAELRQKSESDKARVINKYSSNSVTGLPANYTKPTGDVGPFELFIVEGNSAGGSARIGRLKKTQGVFKIRGKILNVLGASKDKIANNEEIKGITAIILDGKPYRKDFDPYKDCKFDKIIFMPDGDVDGDHIETLLLQLFIIYFPQLIEAGKVYRAMAPLYSIGKGKKINYFTDDLDMIKYSQKFFAQKHTLTLNKKALTSRDYTAFLMTNNELVYHMERLSRTYSVDDRLLDILLTSRFKKLSAANIKKIVKKEFRFMDVITKNGIVVAEGTIKESNKFFMSDRIMEDCKAVFDIYGNNISVDYELDGQPASLYQIMCAYQSCNPSGVQRYKGLGEMDPVPLFESTMDPENRTLIRYTFEDAKAEIDAIRMYKSNKSKLLDLIDD